jgi:signal transduction histidine kinase
MTRRIDEMLKSRDQLLRDVSHELRSPLTRIKVGMELMDDSRAKKGIMEDLSEVETMIAELLETDRLNSRFGKLNPEEIDIKELIQEVIMEFKKKSPGIEMGEFPDKSLLSLDRDRVMILFRNILSNALRYSEEDSEPVRINSIRKDENWTITICDSGIGIPEDELPFIFEPFYRVDKSRSRETGGYGLGMSLSKKIMEAHNGKIEISSTPGKGTCVALTFPAG